MDVIILMFGFGMVVHLAVSLIEEKLFLRKFELKKQMLEIPVSNDNSNIVK